MRFGRTHGLRRLGENERRGANGRRAIEIAEVCGALAKTARKTERAAPRSRRRLLPRCWRKIFETRTGAIHTTAMNAKNARFLFGMTVLFVVFGAILDRLTHQKNIALSCLGVSLALNAACFFFSDRIVLLRANAKPLPAFRAPKIHAIVERLAKRAGIPKPALYWIDTPEANAFATGRDPAHAAVAVTLGLIRTLDEREIEGVLAHEIAHVKNCDTLAASALAAISGTFAYLGRGLLFGGRGAALGGLAAAFRLTVFGALILLVSPFLALIVKLAASRSREYAADEDAAKLMGDPRPLAEALERLDQAAPEPQAPKSLSFLMLSTFSPKAAGGLARALRTHPPLRQRVSRLRSWKKP